MPGAQHGAKQARGLVQSPRSAYSQAHALVDFPPARPQTLGSFNELRRLMPSDAVAGAGALAGRLAALVPRE
jgi:hypothetical protein